MGPTQELPADYRALVERYGPGTIAGLGDPHARPPNRYVDLDRQTGELRGILKDLRERGIEPDYEPDALIPWGIDESGNVGLVAHHRRARSSGRWSPTRRAATSGSASTAARSRSSWRS